MLQRYGPGWRARPLSAHTFTVQLKTYARWAGLEEALISPHVLRLTAAKNMLSQGRSLAEIGEALGHRDLGATRKLLKALRSEDTPACLAPGHRRGVRGGKPGNINGDPLRRYILEMLTTEGLCGPIPSVGAVRLELRILRQAMQGLMARTRRVKDLDLAMQLLDILGVAAMRITRLVEVEHSLAGYNPYEEDRRLDQRYQELQEDEEDGYSALRRLIEESVR
jgi:hypothetical protein